MMDDNLAASISALFRRAFRKDLVVFRAGGSQFPLYVGNRPQPQEGSDELGKVFVDRLLTSCLPLQSQGDGMRSFATVMLHVLVAANHSIQLLDEPEAFLHPPQARLLGEYIASERRSNAQLFISTHSTDILDGLIAAGGEKVRIIRIQRDGDINRIKELSKERTAAIAKDTLTRYSGVFKGIFYQHVVITESDSDCMFYSSILDLHSVSGDEQPDVLFIHASGKHRMAKLAETLRSLDVPVSVITDFDILNDEGVFKGLVNSIGGDWDQIKHNWSAVKNGVEALRSPMNCEQVKSLLLEQIEPVNGVGEFPKTTEREIKRIFRSISPWDAVKQAGKRALSSGPVSIHYSHLEDKCSKFGLWIVPVGELEGFCKTIQASHGPAFVEKILEERDLECDVELSEARDFMKQIWSSF